jgi:predicted permease
MRSPFRRRKPSETDLSDEILHDLAAEIEELMQAGMSREQATFAATRDFGNVSRVKEDLHELHFWPALERVLQDVRYGVRILARNPLFTALAILSLALGIGANTAIYSVMDAVMIRALPVQAPSRLAILTWRSKPDPPVVNSHSGSSFPEPGGGIASPDFPWTAYEALQRENGAFTSLFAYAPVGPPLDIVIRNQAELSPVELVSGNFFTGLGLSPTAGRLFVTGDDRPGAPQIAVLSYQYWQSRFAGDLSAIGQAITIKGVLFQIVGVAPPGFSGIAPGNAPAVYVPICFRPLLIQLYNQAANAMFLDQHNYWVGIMGRLRPGVSFGRAQAEAGARFRHFVAGSARNAADRANLPELRVEEGGSGVDALRRRYAKPLLLLMTMVGCILAIACANIANLLLARATSRRREIAVRLSLGAGRLRLMRQLLTESLLMALPGGLLGLLVASFGIRFLLKLLAGGDENFVLQAQIDWRVLSVTLAVSLGTGLLFGLAPAVSATRVDITPALKETRASSPTRHGFRPGLGQLLLIFQIALSLLLVLGAALFVRTLANLHSVALGFNQESLLTFSLDAGQAGYRDAALKPFYMGLLERFRALPGVRSATMSDLPLVSGWMHGTKVVLPGVLERPGQQMPVDYLAVAPGFFDTMQLPLLMGRSIDSRDVANAPLVAVVNQVFAARYLSKRDPIGQMFGLNDLKHSVTVIGVARNARYNSLKDAIPPVAYVSYLQDADHHPGSTAIFELRTRGNPLALSETIRKTVHDAAPLVPVTGMLTQTQRIDSTITQELAFADLCSAFAGLALAIACVGLYATMSYAVSRRTNEIGIRIALGAERRRILWMILREVLALCAAGLVIGMLCSWTLLSAVQSFTFGIKPADPLSVFSAIAILSVTLLLAALAPASRAASVDPLTALRHE